MKQRKAVPAVTRLGDRPTIGRVITAFLQAHNLNQKDLVDTGSIPNEAMLSNWVQGKRRPSRDNIRQLAEAIDKCRQDMRRRAIVASHQSDYISTLLDLLRAGGYDIGHDQGANLVWDYIQQSLGELRIEPIGTVSPPVIRVAYAEVPPYAKEGDPLNSLCTRVADRIVREMNATPSFQRRSWPTLVEGLLNGEYEMIAPVLMKTPFRAIEGVAFSDSIGLLAGYSALLPQARFSEATHNDSSRSGGHSILIPERITLVQVQGEVGEVFCQLSGRRAEMRASDKLELVPAARSLQDDISRTGRVPCLITETLTCERLVEAYPGLAIAELPPSIPMWYPLAFAVHHREQRLLETLNLGITNLRLGGVLFDWFGAFRDELSPRGRTSVRIEFGFPGPPPTLPAWLDSYENRVGSVAPRTVTEAITDDMKRQNRRGGESK